MEFTKEERNAIIKALEKHLEEIKDREGDIGQDILSLSGELKYDEFIERIIKKLRK